MVEAVVRLAEAVVRLAEAWLDEAERRQREAADDPDAVEDWVDVRQRIAERLRGART